MKTLILYCENSQNRTLSYNDDWFDAFRERKDLFIEACNLEHKNAWLRIFSRIRKYELIVLLHSTNSNEPKISGILERILLWRKARLVFFVGNEFKLIPEKIAMIRRLRAEVVASQLPQDTAEWLYEECRESKILSMPHALNPRVFKPEMPYEQRTIDIGVRGYEYPWYLGDKERIDLMRYIQTSKKMDGLNTDISSDETKRFSRGEWAAFLNNCKGTVSTEAGTSYLERNDATRKAVNAYLEQHPSADFEEVYQKFFVHYKNPVSGKALSSRHFDAIGTKTVQIMFRGRFNDILRAGEHYIALERDFSNIDETLERLKDEKYCKGMTDRTYDYVVKGHTHNHRINDLLNIVGAS